MTTKSKPRMKPGPTFPPRPLVSTKVEKTGRGWCLAVDQHSMVAPRGMQNLDTDSGNWNSSSSTSGYLFKTPIKHKQQNSFGLGSDEQSIVLTT